MANPKNPVRAARQAGRQQIRAAKQARKVAKIENRTASKVAKISGVTRSTGSTGSGTTAPKTGSTTKTGSTNLGVNILSGNYNKPVAKGPSYAPFKSMADKKKSEQMTADSKRRKAQDEIRKQEAAKKKAAADEAARKKKAAQDAKRKKEATERKKKQETVTWVNADGSKTKGPKPEDLPPLTLQDYGELQRQYDEKKSKERITQADMADAARIAALEAKAALENAKEKAKNQAAWDKLTGARYSKDAVEKMKKEKDAKRQESIKKLLPSSYMKKNGGSIKKYQPGGTVYRDRNVAIIKNSMLPSSVKRSKGSVKKYQPGGTTKPIIVKPTIVGKKVGSGPAPAPKRPPALAPMYQTPKQKNQRMLDERTFFSPYKPAPKVKSRASKTKKNK